MDALLRQQQRQEQRREQVLDAASICFRREGFQAASVNRIAEEAQMSVGHLYRYFDSKDAIVIALCERNFEDFISRSPILPGEQRFDSDAVIAAALSGFSEIVQRSKAAFVIEVYSHVERSKPIGDIVAHYDQRLRENAHQFLAPLLPGASEEVISTRIEMLLILIQGLWMRVVGDPAIDMERLKMAFGDMLRLILTRDYQG
ncbi:TetR/AcrR family transcriptional regulator [Sphingobium sp. H39-3-25]|jgi:AcrR family transcriptional regulator|nr:TetR/AcrR family transcriptional regulator [Sphingopyxis fribergensis]MDF0545575.1 TetR/AcrR family transcriptional regulator [Sphingobium arseniciresistens]